MTEYKKNQTMFAVFLTIGFIFLAIGVLSLVENLHITYVAIFGLPFYILAGGFRKKMKKGTRMFISGGCFYNVKLDEDGDGANDIFSQFADLTEGDACPFCKEELFDVFVDRQQHIGLHELNVMPNVVKIIQVKFKHSSPIMRTSPYKRF